VNKSLDKVQLIECVQLVCKLNSLLQGSNIFCVSEYRRFVVL